MITVLSTWVGFVCPDCLSGIGQEINIFRIPKKDALVLSCKKRDCKEEVVRVFRTGQGYRIEVFCALCREVHTFDIKKHTLWQDRLYILHCPNTNFEILFLGEKKTVASAMREQEQVFRDLVEKLEAEHELGILFEIVSAINEKAKANAISCTCGSDDIMVNVEDVGITLTCRECGGEKFFGANRQTLDDILNVSTIVLHK